MCLDIGEKRIGVAVANTDVGIATPLRVLDATEVRANGRAWRMVLEDNEPELLVCGLPKSLSGIQGRQAARIRQQAEEIAARCDVPLEFIDERLSSAEAKRLLREQGLSERDMRGKVDSIAASLILETWLRARAGQEGES